MIQDNHPRISCTSHIPLTIYAIIFSGPFMHTDTPSGTGVQQNINPCVDLNLLKYETVSSSFFFFYKTVDFEESQQMTTKS